MFFAADYFPSGVANRIRAVPFAGRTIRVLCAEDLAVVKVLCDRPKDWVDVATMIEARSLDVPTAVARLESLIGTDAQIERLRALDVS